MWTASWNIYCENVDMYLIIGVQIYWYSPQTGIVWVLLHPSCFFSNETILEFEKWKHLLAHHSIFCQFVSFLTRKASSLRTSFKGFFMSMSFNQVRSCQRLVSCFPFHNLPFFLLRIKLRYRTVKTVPCCRVRFSTCLSLS